MLHVLFTEDGIPGWIGESPREGAEPISGLSIEFLAAHRRTAKGKWVVRSAPALVPPSEEEQRLDADAQRQAASLARDTAVRLALVEDADPLFFKSQRGECAKEDWLTAVETVKARFPKP